MKPTPEEVAEMLNIVGKDFDNILGRELTARRFRAMSATVSELIAENKRLREAGNALVESWRTATEDDDMRTAIQKWETITNP